MGTFSTSLTLSMARSLSRLLLLLMASNAAVAAESAITNRFSGFATIGLVTNDNSEKSIQQLLETVSATAGISA